MSQLISAMRKAIVASKKSRYRIALDTGIAQSQLSRLMSGEQGLSVETMERLAEYLGLEIVIRPQHRKDK